MHPTNAPHHATKPAFWAAFTAHPASVNETYFGHMRFAMGFSGQLLVIAGAALIHALIPAWFETTASDRIKALCARMEQRKQEGS